MAKLSIQEYFNNLRAVGMQLAEEDMPLEIAARDTAAAMFNRIFINGKDAKGGSIGNYNDSTPLYVNPKNLPRKTPPKGKDGDTGDVGDKPRKTAYFDSYLALRADQGVQTKFVDLLFSGRLAFNFVNSSVSTSTGTLKNASTGDIRLEKINKLTFAIRLNKENMGKARGNEVRFSTKIFSVSKEEKEQFKKVLKFETISLMNA